MTEGEAARNGPKQPSCDRFSRFWWWGIFTLIFVSTFFLSGTRLPLLSKIDPSWHAAMEYAALHRLQFGKDIVFTYGPLGFLAASCSQGFFILTRVIWAFVWGGIASWAFLDVVRANRGMVRATFLIWLVLFAARSDFEQHVFFVMAWCSVQLVGNRCRVGGVVAITVLLALLSLIKITFCLAALVTVVIAVLVAASRRDILESVTPVASFTMSFLIFWTLLGQRAENIGLWVRGNLELIAGYGEAMSLTPKPAVLAFSLTALVLFISMYCLAFVRRKPKLGESAVLAIIAVYVFLSWKQGLVRADELHLLRFVLAIPLFAGLALTRLRVERTHFETHLFTGLFLAVVIFSALALNAQHGDLVRRKMAGFPEYMTSKLALIAQAATGRFSNCFEALKPMPKEGTLPLVKSLIGDAPVDVMNSLSWVAMCNGLNYRPRPVIQGYSAYTPYLQQLNLAFMESDKRPEWLLLTLDFFDNKLPTMDDPLLYPWILRNYRPEGAAGDFLLLRMIPGNKPVLPSYQPVLEQSVRFGDPITLSQWHDDDLVLQVEAKTTGLGALAGMVYQRPSLSIELTFGDRTITRRLNPRASREGILLSPLLLHDEDLLGYYRGYSRRLDQVRINCPPNARGLYKEKITIRILRILSL